MAHKLQRAITERPRAIPEGKDKKEQKKENKKLSESPEISEFLCLHQLFKDHYDKVISALEKEQQDLEKLNSTSLPFFIWEKILRLLSPSTIIPVAQVSRYLSYVTARDRIWKTFWKRYIKDTSRLQPKEQTWQLKYRFFSGFVEKFGFIIIRNGSFWTTWDPVFLVISGQNLYCFDIQPEPKKRFGFI